MDVIRELQRDFDWIVARKDEKIADLEEENRDMAKRIEELLKINDDLKQNNQKKRAILSQIREWFSRNVRHG
jgi:flagellar biosynthesis/type III secretory pathway chaperone